MKKLSFIFLLFASYIEIGFAQHWLPLEVGNKWQFKNSKYQNIVGSGPQYSFSLSVKSIEKDTLIDSLRYFFFVESNSPFSDWIRYSNIDNIIYIRWQEQDRIFMNFNKSPGDTFMMFALNHYSYVYGIVSGQDSLFWDNYDYKGYRRDSYSPMPPTHHIDEGRFINNIGWYYFYNASSSTYYGNNQLYSDLLMCVIYDSLMSPIYLTNQYKPEIVFAPIYTTNKRLFRLDINVNHIYNELPSFYSVGFSFTDTVLMESYYLNGDSVIVNEDKIAFSATNLSFILSTTLDTAMLKQGYSFNYRIKAKDKGIIPETSYSPDTGYYKCIWDFSTDINDNDLLHVKEFSLSQNYPNPFNPSTKISWQSPVGSHQTLKVYDVLGREVVTLVNEYREAGSYEVEFDASQLASGVYYYRIAIHSDQLRTGNFIQSKNMMVIK